MQTDAYVSVWSPYIHFANVETGWTYRLGGSSLAYLGQRNCVQKCVSGTKIPESSAVELDDAHKTQKKSFRYIKYYILCLC